ncbi:MAG: DUF3794 domain-containing protein [Oscillospiraceae bacterium]|nr:DUF3794 domain-containing protein [Oscillospiraceae bacterium]
MELKFDRKDIGCCAEVFSQTLRKEDSQDSVVPDTMPDIGEIVCCAGDVLIRGKDVSEGRVRLEANIPARVVYAPEEGNGLYCLDVNLPLYVSMENPAIPADAVCTAELELAALEARTLNPRKISVRAETVFRVRCCAPSQLESAGVPEEETEGVNLLERCAAATPLWTATEKTFVLTDDFTVPSAQPAASSVLCSTAQPRVEEIKCVGNKLVVKGEVCSSLVCLSEEGEVFSLRFDTGFSQVVDAGPLPEECWAAAALLVSGEQYALGSDGRGGSMELHLVLQVSVYGKTELKSVTDAYSSRYPIEIETESTELEQIRGETVLRETLRETLSTAMPVAEVIEVLTVPGLPEAEGGTVTLPLLVQLLYRAQDGTLCAARKSYTLRLSQDLGLGQRLEPVGVTVQETTASPAAGGVELRVPVELRALLREMESLTRIKRLEYDETASLDLTERPSLVLLRATAADDLWTIAKKYCSTVRAITEANGLEELGPGWEKLILIPKTV